MSRANAGFEVDRLTPSTGRLHRSACGAWTGSGFMPTSPSSPSCPVRSREREPFPSQRKLRQVPQDYAAYDDQLLQLAAEMGAGSAGALVDLARERLGLDHFTVARWMWSAWQRGLIVEGDPHYATFPFASRFAKPS